MRVDTTSRSYPYSHHHQQTSIAKPFSNELMQGEALADRTQRIDFTSMTRLEMHNWVNDQIRSGKMLLDDAFPLWNMVMKIPVAAINAGLDAAFENDDMRYDFMRNAQEGISGALSRGDKAVQKMLESAIVTMQRHQGENISVNIRV